MMLRRLTYLSKIDFGHQAGRTVEQILKSRVGRQYMIWLYFNASHIDLCEDLLNELRIKHSLIKPGKDPELFDREYYKDIPGKNYERKSLLSVLPKAKRNGSNNN